MSVEVDLEHDQGVFKLQVSFRSEGRLTAVLGRSGAGKTTLVNVVGGLVRPHRGRVVVDGTILLDTAAGVFVPKHRRRIGYVFQEGRLFPHLTVRQNLLFGRILTTRANRSSGALALDDVVGLLGIEDLLHRRPTRLSGGEKQRVAIGRALLAHPRLLLMDEPLASLDEARKAEILPFIERLRDEIGVPIVYVSHAVSEVARLATTVVVLESGRVAAVGSATEVLGGRLGLATLASDREGGAVLEGRIVEHDGCFGLTRIATPAGELRVPGLDRPVGATVRALVRARDVMLSLTQPERISALNVLSGVVAEIGGGGGAWVELRLQCENGAHLLARVTRKSVAELDLALGSSVFAVIKSVSFDEDPHPAPRIAGTASAPGS